MNSKKNETQKPKIRKRKVIKTRHQTHRMTKKKNNFIQVLIILIAFLLFAYVGFNLLIYLIIKIILIF